MSVKPKVVVGMSGGVDSSVAAALLLQQGFSVIGMMLRLWSEPGAEDSNRCCTPDAMAQARRVSAHLGIPFYAVDAKQVFYQNVVENFIKQYEQGITPNPCLNCNRHIRWGLLYQQARAVGAEFFATGHYARTQVSDFGKTQLLRGIDRNKDQSYVLSVLNQEQLSHSIFPLGGYTKPEVRQLARDFGLAVAERAESQDLCFLAGGDYRAFLQRHTQGVTRPGQIVNRQGKVLGEHEGLAFYTIGQRKGLGFSAPEPLYVLEKNLQDNVLVVGRREELGHSRLVTIQANWVEGSAPPEPFEAQVKIRYKAEEAAARVTPISEEGFSVDFDHALRDITPGQNAAVYQGEVCLGSGIIEQAE